MKQRAQRVVITEEHVAACLPKPAPFVKWVGGKRKLVPELLEYMPASFETYHEPFLGGGALFFACAPTGRICWRERLGKRTRRAVLSDTNSDLIRTYEVVRDYVEPLIEALSSLTRDKATYLELRAQNPALMTNEACALRFIYLLKCGFNGLWRTNKAGKYNVPFGDNTGAICDASTLRAASRALQGVTLRHGDFASILPLPREGDFVYFDPPYVPITATSNFTGYGAGGFGVADQIRLRNHARYLKCKGAHVMLSNSNAPLVHELYGGGDFVLHEIQAARSVNSKGDKRGKITEVVIT